MKYLILVKHSHPQIVEQLPAREWMLSEEGKKRAGILAERLRAYQPEILVSSVEPKALQTAQIIAHSLSLPVQVFENLHEHDRSHTVFLSHQEFESGVRQFFDKPDELVFGNETASQAHTRFDEAVRSVLDQNPGKTIVVVAHGTVISLWISCLTNISAFPLWKQLGLPSFVVLDRQSNTLVTIENIP